MTAQSVHQIQLAGVPNARRVIERTSNHSIALGIEMQGDNLGRMPCENQGASETTHSDTYQVKQRTGKKTIPPSVQISTPVSTSHSLAE